MFIIMAKERISVTIDEKTNKILDDLLKNRRFRNKSHLVEEAILKYIDENGKNIKSK
jgi:metal-responsive CopG/Arc/MetJ family transcriptional regulator